MGLTDGAPPGAPLKKAVEKVLTVRGSGGTGDVLSRLMLQRIGPSWLDAPAHALGAARVGRLKLTDVVQAFADKGGGAPARLGVGAAEPLA
jgi:hypothetical protein